MILNLKEIQSLELYWLILQVAQVIQVRGISHAVLI